MPALNLVEGSKGLRFSIPGVRKQEPGDKPVKVRNIPFAVIALVLRNFSEGGRSGEPGENDDAISGFSDHESLVTNYEPTGSLHPDSVRDDNVNSHFYRILNSQFLISLLPFYYLINVWKLENPLLLGYSSIPEGYLPRGTPSVSCLGKVPESFQ